MILRAIEKAGYRPGEDVAIALDPATTELVEAGSGEDGAPTRYVLATRGPDARLRRAHRPVGRLGRALPDRLDRGRPGRGRLGGLGRRSPRDSAATVQLVGDDLLVTNTERIARAIEERRGELRC